jgi:hypothetical protein
MNSYKITFALNTPLSFLAPPTFDAVLSYAYARETLGEAFTQKLSISTDEMLDFSKMPITMHKDGYFMASSMFFDKDRMTEFTERWRKRWDAKNDHIVNRAEKIPINKAAFKSYDVPYDLKDLKTVWFYFQSDDVEQVRQLVQKWVFFLGKKRSYGNGEIHDFIIEATDFDFSGVFRPVPKDRVDVTELMKNPNFKMSFAYCAWKPPYWLPDNMAECVTIFS